LTNKGNKGDQAMEAGGDNPQHYPVARIAMNVIDCPRNRKQIGIVFQSFAEKFLLLFRF